MATEVSYPCLEIVAGPSEGLVIPVLNEAQVIGRSTEEAKILLEDTSVSRSHASICDENGVVYLEDADSRNGTHVNERKLKKGEKCPLKNLDQIKIGIYTLRLLTRPATNEEILAADRLNTAGKNIANFVSATGDSKAKKDSVEQSAGVRGEIPPAEAGREGLVFEEPGEARGLVIPPVSRLPESPLGVKLKFVFLAICIASGVAGLAYFLIHQKGKEAEKKPVIVLSTEAKSQKVGEAKDAPSGAPPETTLLSATAVPVDGKAQASLRSVPVFLDIQSRPMSARIFFEGKFLGTSPLKAPVELLPDKDYLLTAEFDLKDIHDRYQQKLTFKKDPGKEVIPLAFDADIGVIKITRLPRNVHFYLEGYYAYDKFRANPVKLNDIAYGKPIYVPFGHYTIELREKMKVGDSRTFVDEIRYHREFDVDKERRNIELAVVDRDLEFFPAKIQTNPSGAVVYLDGTKIGNTPFDGDLPLGRHELKLVREGFFDYQTQLDMRTNVPYESKIEMKTSKAGEMINHALELRQAGLNGEVIKTLVDALKMEGGPREKAQVHFLLGETYLMMGSLEQALVYLDQAKAHPDFYYKATLGLARVHRAMGDQGYALTLVIEILLNVGDENPVKKDAFAVFKQLSPLKSVIYVGTEPSGAGVFVNSREVGQKTPLILSDLSLGNYRIEIQKQGYQTEQIKKNLKLSEFVPIVVKLKPEGL